MIACLAVPFFASAVERRADNSLAEQPLAIGGQPWEARPVYAFSREAARQGVRSGMSLRLVQVLSPLSHFIPAKTPTYGRVSAELVDILSDFSPAIEPQELWHSFSDSPLRLTAHGRFLPARYCLDLNNLHLTEAVPFMQEMGKRLRTETSFAPAIGIATDPFTAQVAATISQPNHLLPVAREEHAAFLASRSLRFLPLDKESDRRLGLMGIRTLGQLAGFSLIALQEQFGPEIEPLYQQARGEGWTQLKTQPADQPLQVERLFPEPVSNRMDLQTILSQLSHQLAHRLQTAVLQGRHLALTLEDDEGTRRHLTTTLRQPTLAASDLDDACQALLAQFNSDSGLILVRLSLGDLSPATAQQLTLFPDKVISRRLLQTLQNLAAKYTNSRFYQPTLAERRHPLPERRFQLRPFLHDPAVA